MTSQFMDPVLNIVYRTWDSTHRCQEKNLALNWEKCHFMVT